MKNIVVLIGLLIQSVSLALAADDNFPGRAEYPDVKVMEMDELALQQEKVVIVDARSRLEYETLRIKDAINIPVASKTFDKEVQELRNKTGKAIVFYCNGRTCYKSYKAAREATRLGIKDVYAYDAGMFEWAKAHPDLAVLLGKSPINPNNIISSKQFKDHMLDPDTFSDKAFELGNNSLILDVRDKYQRGASGFFVGKERWISMDDREALDRYIAKAARDKKTLFIYDEVGKQVRWLQYALEQAAVKDYYFMDKGAKEYYRIIMKEAGLKTHLLN